MSDFLSQLARRALQPAAIHPRLPSRFESAALPAGEPVLGEPGEAPSPADNPAPRGPASPPLQWQEPVVTPPSRSVLSAAALPPAPLEAGPAVRPAAVAEPESQQPLPSLRETQAPVVVRIPVEPLSAVQPALPVDSVVAPALRLAAEPGVTPRHEALPLRPAERPEQQALSRERIERQVERLLPDEPAVRSVQPAPSAVAAQAPTVQPQNFTAPPRVEISIGRIEVLPASTPAAPAPVAEAPRRAPAQSLEAYLQERSRPEQGRGGRG
ncbi:hypothetical protein A9179_15525 [Pseudomonas alcaligenes]|uniref:Uncharacterized protein n=1 Tax=Aquipseudomonas alcaligenes TaxID=43263 RepID=A0ABR7S5K7_AQUAC|nr:hypothetical protein [Pseudomonas alcaligenes]MBC9251683.1 hypothetical protein [Pseudomonas alcaligenes]